MLKVKNIESVLIIMIAALPVSAIAWHALGWIELSTSGPGIVLSLWVVMWANCLNSFKKKRLIIRGFLYGVFAVAVYDLSRVPFMMAGWDDFIPAIGDWLLQANNTHPLVGYSWRYIGNGGGLGIAFMFLIQLIPSKKLFLVSTIYGILIWLCLDLILINTPVERRMFDLTVFNMIGSFTGHVVFGFSLAIAHNGRFYRSSGRQVPSFNYTQPEDSKSTY